MSITAYSITENEFDLLDKIAHDEYQPTNCATPTSFDDTSSVWSWSVLESKEDGGTFSSLEKKGLAEFQADPDEKDSDVVWLTEEGFRVWQERRG